MPPVRWKVLMLVCSIYLTNKIDTSEAQLQAAISMSSDGWRPIVGQVFHPEVSRYQAPSQKNEVSTTTSIPSSSSKPAQKQQLPPKPNKPAVLIQKPAQKPKNGAKLNINQPFKKHATKVVRPGQYFGHGPHIPLGGAIQLSRPLQFKKHVNKQHMQNGGGKRIVKPVRNQATAQSNRNEVFVAPPNAGTYSFISHGPINNIKTRETQELGLLGGNHFLSHSLPPNLSNRFAIPSGEQIFQPFGNSPAVQSFLYTKPPNANEVHFPFNQNQNDDYTRNLVPPPLYKKNKNKENLLTVSEQTPHAHQYIKQGLPENVVVQVPPPFEQTFALNSPNVEISKAKLKVFHNRIPANFNPNAPDYSDYDFHNVKAPNDFQNRKPQHSPQQYEVTEGKHTWHDVQPPVFNNFRQPQRVKKPVKPVIQPQVELNFPQFLPTPYRPDKVIPTSPTQSEASTVFTQVSSKMNKFRDQQLTTNPFFFDVKEVSTHYPILGKPETTPTPETEEISNEITTNKIRDPQRPRLNQRRRRPTRPTTTSTTEEAPVPVTDNYEAQKTAEEPEITERPQRRRPNRYRTSTEKVEVEETFNRNRYKSRGSSQRKRVKPTESASSEKITDTIINESITDVPVVKFIETTPKEEYPSDEEEYSKNQKVKYEFPNGYYDSHRYDSYEDISSETETPKKPEIIATTKTAIDIAEPTTVPPVPDNEVDFSQSSTIKPEATLATTTPTTTSTESTTTKSTRSRGRPLKYETSNRPRFSVKDYRQRLNQYTSSTSTTESSRSTTDSNRLNRFSSRLRTRPTLGTTTAVPEDNEEHTDSVRSRFKPKDPRHRLTTTESPNEAIITEKNVKAINTRLRPFGKYRSTTEIPSTTKVAIKTNLFSQRRRPPQLSLRARINNKLNKTSTDERTTTMSPDEVSESTDDAIITTLAINNEPNDQNEVTELPIETTVTDIMKNDAMLYSQRVSDLTSSFQNEYNTPGLFKSVSPTSRRIPNYFTLATDEPKLPIEAFFPNLMDKEKGEGEVEE